jgi:hypothetical protein
MVKSHFKNYVVGCRPQIFLLKLNDSENKEYGKHVFFIIFYMLQIYSLEQISYIDVKKNSLNMVKMTIYFQIFFVNFLFCSVWTIFLIVFRPHILIWSALTSPSLY